MPSAPHIPIIPSSSLIFSANCMPFLPTAVASFSIPRSTSAVVFSLVSQLRVVSAAFICRALSIRVIAVFLSPAALWFIASRNRAYAFFSSPALLFEQAEKNVNIGSMTNSHANREDGCLDVIIVSLLCIYLAKIIKKNRKCILLRLKS